MLVYVLSNMMMLVEFLLVYISSRELLLLNVGSFNERLVNNISMCSLAVGAWNVLNYCDVLFNESGGSSKISLAYDWFLENKWVIASEIGML